MILLSVPFPRQVLLAFSVGVWLLSRLTHTALSAEPLSFHTVGAPGAAYVRAVFLSGENPVLYVRFDPVALPKEFRLSVQLYDFWGARVGSGTVEPQQQPGDFALRLAARKPGWYRVQLAAFSGDSPVPVKRTPANTTSTERYDFITYAVVPSPLSTSQVPDSPFGVMTSLNPEHMPIAAQVELAGLTGCRWTREILSWRKIHPERDQLDLVKVKSGYEALAARGLKILSTLTTSPPWLRPHSDDKFSYPRNLLAAHDSARRIATELSPLVAAYEIWNEPDILHYSIGTPDRYAALVKAVSLGIRGAGRNAEVLGGAFARDPRVGRYDQVLAANGIGGYLDAYTFHTYQPIATGVYAEVLRVHREVAAGLGMKSKPLWLTETSLPYSRGEIPEPLPAMAAQVRQLVESYMRSIAGGVKPVFWFIIRPYFGKNQVQFGLVDSRLSPLPAFSALAVMTHELGVGKFLGSFEYDGSSIYLFDNGLEEVAVVIGKDGRDGLALPPIADEARAVNVMGRPAKLQTTETEAMVASGGFAAYIHQPGWHRRVTSVSAKREVAGPVDDDKLCREIILQMSYPDRFIDKDTAAVRENWDGIATNWTPRGYHCTQGETVPMNLEVYNFGTSSKDVSIAVLLPEGCSAEPPGATVTVDPLSRKDIAISIHARQADAQPGFWKITGTASDGLISPAASLWTINPK